MSLTPALPRRRGAAAPRVAYLFEVLDCGAPLRPPARHPLGQVTEVVLGRGESAAIEAVTLRLGIGDRWMSERHARLRRLGEEWEIEDLGSTNGTRVNGEVVERRLLADGDAVEVGRTHLLFRAELPLASPWDPPLPALSTLSPALAEELARVPAIAHSAVPVVIAGETGTGKEILARALHELSHRRGAFVAVNCAAIAPALLESELFGHRKGAFSGAAEARPGLFRAADRGTLLLDEIAELPPAAQAALLRVLQEGEVLAVGETEPARVDVRVLAASHQDLEQAVAAGRFRADLFARLCGFTLRLPPLRRRREDLGLLIAALLRKHGAAAATFSAEAGRALLRHRWPLNVRELEQCIASALALAGGGPIDVPHLPETVLRPPPAPPAIPGLLPRPLTPADTARREELAALLREHRGNVAAVARVLGKARMQVHRWVKRFDLHLADYR